MGGEWWEWGGRGEADGFGGGGGGSDYSCRSDGNDGDQYSQ